MQRFARQMHASRAAATLHHDFLGEKGTALEKVEAWQKSHQGIPGQEFQDLIERWNHRAFYSVGMMMGAGTAALAFAYGPFAVAPYAAGAMTLYYFKMGWQDMSQDTHTIRRNFPVLGRARYILEMLRPEIRQVHIACVARPHICSSATSRVGCLFVDDQNS
jgi:hypothetical protein